MSAPVSTDRAAPEVLAGIAAAAAGGAALAGAEPVGQPFLDAVETMLAVGLVVWFGSRAPWWLQVAAAAASFAIGLDAWAVVLGVLGFAVASWVSPLEDALAPRAIGGALAVGLTCNAFIRSDLGGFTGVSAIVGLGFGLALLVTGLVRSSPSTRRLAWRTAAVVGVLLVVAGAGAYAIARSSRVDASRASRAATGAVRELRALDADAAESRMRDAADELRSIDRRAGAWWAAPTRLVPVLAQHRSAAAVLGSELAEQVEGAADDIGMVPLDDLGVSGGRIDLAAVDAVGAPLDRLVTRMDTIDRSIDDARSVWLVSSVGDRIDEIDLELDAVRPDIDLASRVVELAPRLLGGGETRRYLLLFTTPAEARGLGGFIGNYAVLEIDDGLLQVAEMGRRSELEADADANDAVVTGPPGLLATYGKFGIVGDDGTVGHRSWSNLTMEPDWPSFAPAAVELFGQTGREPADGVVVLDTHVLQALLRYTGPIDRPGGGRQLTQRNLAEYLLTGQYGDRDDDIGRVDALEQISEDVVRRLLTSDLPRLDRVAADLAPLVDEQRLLVWTTSVDEQDVLRDAGLGEGLPDIEAADGFSLAITNAGASKIDAFLDRTVELERFDRDGGAWVRATVRLTNDVPTTDLPDYVVGNSLDLPDGTSQLYLVAYTSTIVETVAVGADDALVERGEDGAWQTAAHTVTLAPGASATIEYLFPARSSGDIATRLQPLARRDDEAGP